MSSPLIRLMSPPLTMRLAAPNNLETLFEERARARSTHSAYRSTASYEQPLTHVLKKALVNSYNYLSSLGKLDGLYPVPDKLLPSRDLTIMLIKQHEFLVNRVALYIQRDGYEKNALEVRMEN